MCMSHGSISIKPYLHRYTLPIYHNVCTPRYFSHNAPESNPLDTYPFNETDGKCHNGLRHASTSQVEVRIRGRQSALFLSSQSDCKIMFIPTESLRTEENKRSIYSVVNNFLKFGYVMKLNLTLSYWIDEDTDRYDTAMFVFDSICTSRNLIDSWICCTFHSVVFIA